jgi:ABC-type sugar transport system substrate-binding protein
MKKSLNTLSPFVMLLVPVLLLAGISTANAAADDEAGKSVVATVPSLKMPNLTEVVKAIF